MTPEAALVAMSAALETVDVRSGYRLSGMTPPMGPTTLAAAILDALPPDWCGHLSRFEDMTLEVARLRAALTTARLELMQDVEPDAVIDGIDAALDGKP